MRKYNLVVAFGSAFFGLLILYFGRNLAGWDSNGVPGENYWPFIIAGLLIGLGVLQLLQVIFAQTKNADKIVDLHSPPVRKAYLAALISVAYAGLLLCAGFIAATLIFIPSVMTLMGERRVWVSALAAVAVVGTIYVFFALVFNTTLPTSIFLE